jgi:hypothetical protein
MATSGNVKATVNKAKANGYETKPNVGHNASRIPRKVIFSGGGTKSAPKAPATTKS